MQYMDNTHKCIYVHYFLKYIYTYNRKDQNVRDTKLTKM